MSISVREVYKGGIVIPENKGIEISCICECDRCKKRYEYTKYREYRSMSFKNRASIIVWNEDKINKAIEFAKEWKCRNGEKELPDEYIHYDEL